MRFALLLGLVSVTGCASILGADFDKPAGPQADGDASQISADNRDEDGLDAGASVDGASGRDGGKDAKPDVDPEPVELTCTGLRADCDDDKSNGCEVDLASDPKHCGECGKACGSGEVCGPTGCASTCTAGLATCGQSCVSLDADPANCGSCGKVCPGPAAHGVAVCNQKQCGIKCASGYAACASGCCATTPPPPPKVVSIGAGDNHTCAVYDNGTAKCWGDNGSGQLGDGTVTWRDTPTVVTGLSDAKAIYGGASHTCAITGTGTVKCWGKNDVGQLGDGTTTKRLTPVTVSGFSTAKELALGEAHSCAVLKSGGVKCWGSNQWGQLGDGTQTNRKTAVSAQGISTATGIGTGNAHTCAVMTAGDVKCWGENLQGQLGDQTNDDRLVPTSIAWASPPRTVKAITAGDRHTCGIESTGEIVCWGSNGYNTLGSLSASGGSYNWPSRADAFTNATAVAAGHEFSCAIQGGYVSCWGLASAGQCGEGSPPGTGGIGVTPVIGNKSDAIALALGMAHACALYASGQVQCWGWNGSGQLGMDAPDYCDTAAEPCSLKPRPVTGL